MSICQTKDVAEYIKRLTDRGIPYEEAFGSRGVLYETLPSNAIVAEIGVDRGDNAAAIYELCAPKELYLIDPWDMCEWSNKRWDTKKHKEVTFDYFSDKDGVTLIQDYSVEASKKFENHYFDWIHFDASYEYKDAKADLAHWLPKVKKGGYITGDEFNLHGGHWPGVYSAVLEFIIKYVEKKPEILKEFLEQRAHHNDVVKEKIASDPEKFLKGLVGKKLISVFSQKHSFADVHVVKQELYELQFKAPPEFIDTIMKWIECFPSTRWRGGSYKLQVGDWVDDLNYEEIIEDANKVEKDDRPSLYGNETFAFERVDAIAAAVDGAVRAPWCQCQFGRKE
jgi:hypothetical protein